MEAVKRKWYSTKEASQYFGYSEATIRHLAHADKGRKFSMIALKNIKIDIEALEKTLRR